MRDRMKRALGWLCYRIVIAMPAAPSATGVRGWMLSWAGYYASLPVDASK